MFPSLVLWHYQMLSTLCEVVHIQAHTELFSEISLHRMRIFEIISFSGCFVHMHQYVCFKHNETVKRACIKIFN